MSFEGIKPLFKSRYLKNIDKVFNRIAQIYQEHEVLGHRLSPLEIVQYDNKEVVIYNTYARNIVTVFNRMDIHTSLRRGPASQDKVFTNKFIPGQLMMILLPQALHYFYTVRTVSVSIGKIAQIHELGILIPFACKTSTYIKYNNVDSSQISNLLSILKDLPSVLCMELLISELKALLDSRELLELVFQKRLSRKIERIVFTIPAEILYKYSDIFMDAISGHRDNRSSYVDLEVYTYVLIRDYADFKRSVARITTFYNALKDIPIKTFIYYDMSTLLPKLVEMRNDLSNSRNVSLLPYIRMGFLMEKRRDEIMQLLLKAFKDSLFDSSLRHEAIDYKIFAKLITTGSSPCRYGRILLELTGEGINVSTCILEAAIKGVKKFDRHSYVITMLRWQDEGLCASCPYSLACPICRIVVEYTRTMLNNHLSECPFRCIVREAAGGSPCV